MPEGFAKLVCLVFGGVLAIIGLGGVPLAVLNGSWSQLILYVISLFAGIGILGWASKG